MASFDFNSEINVNILGHIFEQSISDIEELQQEGVSRRKKDGVYYTPEYITDYICRNTIIPYLSTKNATNPRELVLEYSNDIEELERKFAEIKILDPACGSGAFLIKAVDVLLEINKEVQLFKQDKGGYTAIKKGRKVKKDVGQLVLRKWHDEDEARNIIENNIFGVDINEESVEITKLSLFLKIARKNKKLIDLSKNIKNGNSLVDNKEFVGEIAFRWKDNFKKIYDQGKFDIVIGNPPWGAEFGDDELEYIKSKNQEIIVRMIDSFMFFMNLSLELVSDTGKIGMIVPDVILYQKDNEKLRKTILDNIDLSKIVNLGDNVFEDVTRPSCITVLSKTSKKTTEIIDISKEKNKDILNAKSLRIPKDTFYYTPMNIFPTTNVEGYKLLKSLKSTSPLYDSIDSDGIQRGISPDYNDAFIVDKKSIETHNLEKTKLKKTVTGGKDVKKYYIKPVKKYLIYTSRKDDFRKIPNICNYILRFKNNITCKEVKQGKHPIFSLHRPRKSHIFEKEQKILGVITSDKIITAIDKEQLYPTDGVYLFSPKQEINAKYLVAVLNSIMFTYLYRLYTLEIGRPLAQIKPKILETIPLPIVDNSRQEEMEAKADIIIGLKKKKYSKKRKFIRLIKSNFSIEKTSKKLESFFNLNFNELKKELERLSKTKLSFRQQDELIDVFDKYKGELLELQKNIAGIDNEIDEMVFDLYNLKEEEKEIIRNY